MTGRRRPAGARTERLLTASLMAILSLACGPGGEPGADAGAAARSVTLSRLAFSGGPEGGTFQYFSNGISIRLSKAIPGVEVSNTASAGSLWCLRLRDKSIVPALTFNANTILRNTSRVG